MKPLLPTLREKKRYVAYEVMTTEPLGRDVSGELLRHLSCTLGVFGMADAGILSISYNAERQRGVLRVANRMVPRVKAGLLLTKRLDGQRVSIRTLTVSGMLRKAKGG